jgi:hypothetical protein
MACVAMKCFTSWNWLFMRQTHFAGRSVAIISTSVKKVQSWANATSISSGRS